jgi:hypothetical protein
MIRMKLFLLGAIPALLVISSCNNNGIGNSKDANPQSIYFDYRVSGEEEAGYITVRLQYRFAGPSGSTLSLQSPSKAELDGVMVTADSSRMSGVYYEITKPVQEFTGHHEIVFTDKNGKQYKEGFNFQPISLQTKLGPIVNRSDLNLDLEGLAKKDQVHILLSDTAKFSEGIDRVDTIQNGHIMNMKDDLLALMNGPIGLEISKEDEREIQNGTREGGKLSIFYKITRQFELRD